MENEWRGFGFFDYGFVLKEFSKDFLSYENVIQQHNYQFIFEMKQKKGQLSIQMNEKLTHVRRNGLHLLTTQ